MNASSDSHSHFEGKDAMQHVVDTQAKGIIAGAESHGSEVPGHISAGADAARETAILLALIWITLNRFEIDFHHTALVMAVVGCTWVCWRFGRSAWLGWSRLERLHRVVQEERYEILHHRQQERDELRALYGAKGFEGELLEDVVDVLMSDNDRLLRVMLEEELGLKLEAHEHPLKQGLGAALGAFSILLLSAAGIFIVPPYGLLVTCLASLGFAAGVAAVYEGNRIVPAVVWNVGMGVVTFGVASLVLDFLL